MSMNLELKARLERLGPVRVVDQDPLSSDELTAIGLRRDGSLDQPVSVARRLRAAGATLRAAHTAITRLAADGAAVCDIARAADLAALAADLGRMNVFVRRRRDIADPAAFITEIRTRRGLSQREFADALGLDVRTLQNWEQGRNRPDAAVLSLIGVFDRSPETVAEAVFEPVA
jgi:DNA-binding transcriptional regulator YiaG